MHLLLHLYLLYNTLYYKTESISGQIFSWMYFSKQHFLGIATMHNSLSVSLMLHKESFILQIILCSSLWFKNKANLSFLYLTSECLEIVYILITSTSLEIFPLVENRVFLINQTKRTVHFSLQTGAEFSSFLF